MFRHLSTKWPSKVAAGLLMSALAVKAYQKATSDANGVLQHQAAGFNYSRRLYPASSEYPDLTRHRNIMSRKLSKEMYARLRDRRTSNGFTLDDAIQTGVDNTGKFSTTGIVAGDADSYVTFKELFDGVIAEKHGQVKHDNVIDLDASKLTNAQLDANYVLSVRIQAVRNLTGYCFPTFCTRGERRDVESILVKALYGLKEQGTYYSLKELTMDEEAALVKSNVWMERPFFPDEVSANLGRDWPDARGIWLNDSKDLFAQVNNKDHLLVGVLADGGDVQAAFAKFANLVKTVESQVREEKWTMSFDQRLGYLTSDPADLGAAIKLSANLKLNKLSGDARFSALLKICQLSQSFRVVKDDETTGGDTVVEVSSFVTMGKSEVQIAQSFVDSLNKLIEAEKRIEKGAPLDDILYS